MRNVKIQYHNIFLEEHCEENQFRCGNGNCIPIEYRCDRFSNVDCSDGSDEDNCGK